jgi:hypothetical protein
MEKDQDSTEKIQRRKRVVREKRKARREGEGRRGKGRGGERKDPDGRIRELMYVCVCIYSFDI